MKRGRLLVNIVNEKYKENLVSANDEDLTTNLDTEAQINKENIPLNTIIMTNQAYSRQIENDLASPSEESFEEEWGTNFNLDEDRNQVKWQDIKVLRVEKENPGAFFYKTSFSDENYKKVSVRKRRTKDDQIVFTGLKQAYTQKIPLSEAKVKDIKELITKNAIPQQYVDSYFKIFIDIN